MFCIELNTETPRSIEIKWLHLFFLFQPPMLCTSCPLFVVSLPLRSYMDLDISLSGEEVDRYMRRAIVMFLSAVDTLKELLFVKNVVESLKVR